MTPATCHGETAADSNIVRWRVVNNWRWEDRQGSNAFVAVRTISDSFSRFGNELRGLPESIRREEPSRNLKLPMHDLVRSLNLASTVNTVVYKAVRQFGGLVP